MVISPEQHERETGARPPERQPGAPRSRMVPVWTLVGIALAVAAGAAVWALLAPAGEEATITQLPPGSAITAAQHDAAITQAVRERLATQHDSGITQTLRERTPATPSTHDAGIAQAVSERSATQHDSWLTQAERQRTTLTPSTHDSGIARALRERAGAPSDG